MVEQCPSRPIVIDTDMGVDDAIAIMIAYKHPDIDLKALTVVHGNVGLKQGIENAKTVVKVLKAQERVQIYAGCNSSMVFDKDNVIPYVGHGQDGLGNHQKHYYQEVLKDESDVNVQPEHAIFALCQLARQYRGQLEIHAIGPLTNLAMAYRIDSNFFSNLKSLYIMGGSQLAKGNVSRAAEFNFYSDPEAAYVVFSAMDKLGKREEPLIKVATYECCMENGIPWSFYHDVLTSPPYNRFNQFLKSISSSIETLVEEEKKANKKPKQYRTDRTIFAPCDMFSVIASVEPESVLNHYDQHVEIELQGKHTRGMMAIDWYDRESELKPPNCRILGKMNTSTIERVLQSTFKGHFEASNQK